MTSTPALHAVPPPASRTVFAPDVRSEPVALPVPAGGSFSERRLHTARTLDGVTEAERLGEAIAELAARLHAATYELLVLLRQFDERAGWNCGFLSCAHWLHWRPGIDLGAAREKVRVAKALTSLPRVSVAMQRGVISYAKVRAVTRVATRFRGSGADCVEH